MQFLGLETSCDDTGFGLYDTQLGLLGHVVHRQSDLHLAYGGVVPELASRDHLKRLVPLLESLQAQTDLDLKQLAGIAYTKGPGLLGALLVGATFARALGQALAVPTLGVHHLEGHLLVPQLAHPEIEFPFLALLVSGGHTQWVHVEALGVYKVLGETLDDAVGEAFDKVAKLLGLPYPGGPHLEQMAKTGRSGRFLLPRPMLDRPTLDFSFSGLKTAVVHLLQKLPAPTAQDKADVALAFQEAAIDTLVAKCARALQTTQLQQVVVAGGVSANMALQTALKKCAHEHGAVAFFPPLGLCADNGAMIAYAGALRMQRGERDGQDFSVHARWPLSL